LWIASGGVQTDKTKESSVEFMKELRDRHRRSKADLARPSSARHAWLPNTRGYAQQFEGYQRIAQQIADLWIAGLPMSTLQAEPEELNRLDS
jgi:hypothetical protein